MPNYYGSVTHKETLQPGARGERFVGNMPGYRNNEERINRTNNQLTSTPHDTVAKKLMLDPRLPALFRYGWAFGYNQITIPKGRIVAVDPELSMVDSSTKTQGGELHHFNVMTLANGGKDVDLNPATGEWIEAAEEFVLNVKTGKDQAKPEERRPANKPIGVIFSNMYTRAEDAFNGIMPSPIRTDCFIELPWFGKAEDAINNPWGAVAGAVKPGDLVKSDENGRFVRSPLMDKAWLAGATAGDIELERQQIVGEVLSVVPDLVPQGAARFAQWSLDDRQKFDEFNPYEYPATGRPGEDTVSNTYFTVGVDQFGYPYDKAYMDSDLHMLESTARDYDKRMQAEYQMELGIPGLTDGKNTGKGKQFSNVSVGQIGNANGEEYLPVIVRVPEVAVEKLEVCVGEGAYVEAVAGTKVEAEVNGKTCEVEIQYADAKQGMIVLVPPVEFKDLFVGETIQSVDVKVNFFKGGLPGVPTFLDWKGVEGVATILLTK